MRSVGVAMPFESSRQIGLWLRAPVSGLPLKHFKSYISHTVQMISRCNPLALGRALEKVEGGAGAAPALCHLSVVCPYQTSRDPYLIRQVGAYLDWPRSLRRLAIRHCSIFILPL